VSFVVVAIGVTLYTTGPLYRIRTWWSFDDPLADDPVIIGVYAAVGVVGVAVLVEAGRWRRIPVPLAATGAAVVAWYLLSAIWSRDPTVTVRETLFVGTALVAGAAAAVLLPLRQLGWAIWCGVHVGLLWSFVALRTEATGTIDLRGNYAGIFFNRNSLALYAALGGLLGVLLVVDAVQRFARERELAMLPLVGLAIAGFGIEAWLISGADAATPTVAAALALAAAAIVHASRRLVTRGVPAGRVAAGGGVVALVVTGVAWFTRGSWLDAVGRDSDLTGRTGVWEVAVDWAGRRPLHGYGYLGLWDDRRFLREVRRASGHRLMSSHNSFIEALLGGGAIGLALFFAFVAVLYMAVTTRALAGRSLLTLWPFGVFAFVVLENLTETLVVGNQLTVALLTATAVAATPGVLASSEQSVFSPISRYGSDRRWLVEDRTHRL
jgi:O-antigen ligase